MSIEKIESLVDSFVKLAYKDSSLEAKIVPIEKAMTALATKLVKAGEDETSSSPDAQKWKQLKKQFWAIVNAWATDNNIAFIEAAGRPDARVGYYRSLKARIARQQKIREGGKTYAGQAAEVRANRALVMFLEKLQAKAGVDKGLFQTMSNQLDKQQVPKNSIVANLEIYPQNRPYPNFKVSGGNPTQQKWVAGNLQKIAQVIYRTLASNKALIPKKPFSYKFVTLPM